MIDESGIDDKRDKSRGINRVISGFRIKNSRMVISSGMVIVCPVPMRILRSRFKGPDGTGSQQAQRPGDSDLRAEISEAIKSKHLLVLKDPWHGLNIEKYRSSVQIKCFNNIMIETGSTTNLILGSVEVVFGAWEFIWWSCVRWIDGSNIGLDVITRRNLGVWYGSRRLPHLENLNNINVNAQANSEIVHIIREQNTEIAWALDSRNNHIQPPMFSKLHTIVNYGSLQGHSLGSVHSSWEN
jgi:hypothetical protein